MQDISVKTHTSPRGLREGKEFSIPVRLMCVCGSAAGILPDGLVGLLRGCGYSRAGHARSWFCGPAGEVASASWEVACGSGQLWALTSVLEAYVWDSSPTAHTLNMLPIPSDFGSCL